jgi:hypothetical protein
LKKTIKNIEIISITQAIGELMTVKLPMKTSWNLNKNMKKFTEAMNDYNEFDKKLLEKYAIKDEEGKVKIINNKCNIPPKYIDEFNQKKNELLSMETEIDYLTIQLDVDDLASKGVEITTATLFNLEFMIEEKAKEEDKNGEQ